MFKIRMENLFDKIVLQKYIGRIMELSKDSKPLWGKMTVDEMLAHVSVTYEMVYESQRFTKPGFVKRFILERFIKYKVVGEKPYKKNVPTATVFKKSGKFDFEMERKKLVGFLQKTQNLGSDAFEGKESKFFGKLSSLQWNTMFVKHLNHHLTQFGV